LIVLEYVFFVKPLGMRFTCQSIFNSDFVQFAIVTSVTCKPANSIAGEIICQYNYAITESGEALLWHEHTCTKAPVCINLSALSHSASLICVENCPGNISNILYYKSRDVSTQLDTVLLRIVSCLTILTEAKCKRFATTVTRLLSSFLFC
jgi:hypothetical protein